MDITFKYNGKLISTPNLEKKLKKMKLQLSDIEIVEIPKKEEQGEEIYDKKMVIIRSTLDEIRRVCYIPKDHTPTIYELFKDVIWNPVTKTGRKDITNETLMTMYYDKI